MSVALRLTFLIALPAALAGCNGNGHDEVARLPAVGAAAATPILEPQDVAAAAAAASPGASPAPAPVVSGWTGSTEARRRSTISPRVSGMVTKVHVRDGDRVKSGDPLVTLDPLDFSLRTKQAEASLAAAVAQKKAAESDWNRTKALVKDAAVPQAQFDAVDARYQGALAGMAQAEVAVAMARKAEKDATVRAPYDAIVVRRAISEGEYASVMPATQLVTLEEAGVLEVRLFLAREQADRLQIGATARAASAELGREFDAKVVRILPPRDPKTGAFTVIYEVADPDELLWPGMRVTVSAANGRERIR